MDVLLSAVLGEAITRSINIFISKCSRQQAQDVEDHLRRVLLRAQVIIDEAMGRQLTNQAMLLQLDMLTGAMHGGYYMLDAFRYQSPDKEDAKDKAVSQSLSLPKVNSSKYLCSTKRKTQIFEQLQEALESLNNLIFDANEFVIFLKSCPRMCRQPYSMHLLLANCMFDRKMETELVISFLLQTKAPHAEELEVLPIVGPGRVGKKIVFLTDHDFRDKVLYIHRQGNAMEHQFSTIRKDGRLLLVIIEVAGDVTEDAWKKLCSAVRRSTPNGIKIIITSRSDMIKKFGTTGVITLAYPSIAFGSTDPGQHPRLASVAMEIARMLNTCYKTIFDINFWFKFLVFIRGLIQKHIAKYGEHPWDLLYQTRPTRLGRMMGRASEDLIIHDQYQRSSQEAVPNRALNDVMYGSVKPDGKFEVLAWRSLIPPYYNCIYTCQIQDLKTRAANKRKRSQNNAISL
ncbi:hypothetical protein BS78_02G010200 [Paspalum vaginatum]|nr:hypothetical protein BS78_02G010200 [Paspalum vaginatum]